MLRFHIGIVPHSPADCESSTAVIHLLEPVKKSLIENSDNIQQFSTNDEVSSHHLINILREARVEINMKIPINWAEVR